MYFRSQIKQISVILAHLKLCLATATHNFKLLNNIKVLLDLARDKACAGKQK